MNKKLFIIIETFLLCCLFMAIEFGIDTLFSIVIVMTTLCALFFLCCAMIYLGNEVLGESKPKTKSKIIEQLDEAIGRKQDERKNIWKRNG